ncbi:MAG TPA: cupin domain-containing protein [Dongiaceae bacterium]|nr:cupin domain-containing protein [Dongiaceae bacterium]
MSNQDIIRTENVLVRVMDLEKDASTGWHHHTEVSDYFVCLNGVVQVEARNPDEVIILHPGQRTEIKPPQVHRVLNTHTDKSEYLLIQGVGTYDFIK